MLLQLSHISPRHRKETLLVCSFRFIFVKECFKIKPHPKARKEMHFLLRMPPQSVLTFGVLFGGVTEKTPHVNRGKRFLQEDAALPAWPHTGRAAGPTLRAGTALPWALPCPFPPAHPRSRSVGCCHPSARQVRGGVQRKMTLTTWRLMTTQSCTYRSRRKTNTEEISRRLFPWMQGRTA